MINTEAESTRTILPKIILPQLIKFYGQHKEGINDLILTHRKRRLDKEQRDRNMDICIDSDEDKKKPKSKKRDIKDSGKEQETKEEKKEEIDEEQVILFDHLTHNLSTDSSLLQIDDIDINYIAFNGRPLVLSTENQLEEACDKELENIKVKKSKNKNPKKSNKFNTFASIDNLSKKEADTVGTLQSKIESIQSIIDSSCNRSVKEFLKNSDKGKKSINSRRSKRVKNETKVDEDLIDNVYFDPIISLYFYFRQHLLSEKWNVRQY